MHEARNMLQENVPDPGKSLYSQTKMFGKINFVYCYKNINGKGNRMVRGPARILHFSPYCGRLSGLAQSGGKKGQHHRSKNHGRQISGGSIRKPDRTQTS